MDPSCKCQCPSVLRAHMHPRDCPHVLLHEGWFRPLWTSSALTVQARRGQEWPHRPNHGCADTGGPYKCIYTLARSLVARGDFSLPDLELVTYQDMKRRKKSELGLSPSESWRHGHRHCICPGKARRCEVPSWMPAAACHSPQSGI